MANNRVIGVELGWTTRHRQAHQVRRERQTGLWAAEQSAEGLDQAMKKGGQQAKRAEGAMEQVERRAGSLASRVNVLGASFKRLQQAAAWFGAPQAHSSGIFSLQGAWWAWAWVSGQRLLKVADNTDRMKIALDQLTNGKGEEWFRKLNAGPSRCRSTGQAIEAFIRLRAFAGAHHQADDHPGGFHHRGGPGKRPWRASSRPWARFRLVAS